MLDITAALVRELINEQFPQWADLDIYPVAKSGHDNRTFHLGSDMTVRLPSGPAYASAVEKEARWLPVFQPRLSLPIPVPLALGSPTERYPLPWSVNRWIDGETLTRENVRDMEALARDLAGFLRELEAIDATGGVPAGKQNFHRGGDLSVYDDEARTTIERVSGLYDPHALTEMWEAALSSRYDGPPRWVHGDVATGNLLVQDGRLCGVIDFGTMGVGDPSCDLVMAWNFFDAKSRALFLSLMDLGEDATRRARGWALWKALITYDWNEKGSELATWGKLVLNTLVNE